VSCSDWPPPRRNPPFYIIIASSILTVEETLLLKTLKAGDVGRLAAVFRVDRIIVYRDEDSDKRDYRLLRLLLRYMATPPYLRRRIFPIMPELRYAGLLPPLRTPLHDIPREPEPGVYVAGLVESCRGRRCRVYLGRYGTGVAEGGRLRPGGVYTFRVVEVAPLRLEYVADPDFYTGYSVEGWPVLRQGLAWARGKGWTIVGTSRRGSCFSSDTLRRILEARRGPVAFVFGGPRGDVVREAGEGYYDIVVNTIPHQGTRTVRTEEALAATLALFNACPHAAQSL